MQRRSSPKHDDLSAETIIKEELIIEEKVCSNFVEFEFHSYYILYSYSEFLIHAFCGRYTMKEMKLLWPKI